MAFTITAASAGQPVVEGSRRKWRGNLTVDNSYVNATGFTVPATLFGLQTVEFCNMDFATVFTHSPVYQAGGANLVFKVMVEATAAELASSAGTGLIFPIEVVGI